MPARPVPDAEAVPDPEAVLVTSIASMPRRGSRWPRRDRLPLGRCLVLLLGALLAACSSSSSSSPSSGSTSSGPSSGVSPPGATGRPVTIPGSEVRTLVSKQTGVSYDLYLSYPDDYSTNTSLRYPVVYVLDGQWDFKLVRSIYENGLYDGTLPALIIVGITWSGTNPDYGSLRNHDLTPTADASVAGSGGAPAFLRFLKSEAMPYVEAALRADPRQRVLVGSSYGGLFDLYAMYTEPTLFAGYVCNSPAVTFGDNAIGEIDARFAAARQALPARLWVSVGASENLHGPVLTFLETLRGRHYSGLQLKTRELEGERHAASRVEAFNRGLRYAFGSD